VRALPKPTWHGVLGEDQWRSSRCIKPPFGYDEGTAICHAHGMGRINIIRLSIPGKLGPKTKKDLLP
jgi:hypothetical protein